MRRRGIVVVALLGSLLLGSALQAQEQNPNLARLIEAWETLTGRHFRELTPEEQQALAAAAIHAMEATLQGQAAPGAARPAAPPDRAAIAPVVTEFGGMPGIPIIGRLFQAAGAPGAGGIGVELEGKLDEGGGSVTVRNVLAGSPAEAAGLQAGDRITAVDGTTIADLGDLTAIARAVRGDPGTEVQLEVLRGEEPLTITIKRAELQATMPTVQAQMLNDLALVTVGELRESTPRDCVQALTNLEREDQQAAKPRGLLLDLIGSSGGDLEVVQRLAGLFMEGPVARIRYRDGKEEVRETIAPDDPLVLPEMPKVVLVDDHTSGPAVLLAAALRDAGVAEVLGLTTEPAGGLTEPAKLTDGTEVQLVSAGFLAPNGDDHSMLGLQPDVVYDEQTAQAGEGGDDGEVQVLPGGVTLRRRAVPAGENGAGGVALEVTAPALAVGAAGPPVGGVWGFQNQQQTVVIGREGNRVVVRGEVAQTPAGGAAEEPAEGEEGPADQQAPAQTGGAAGEGGDQVEAPVRGGVQELNEAVDQFQQALNPAVNLMWAGPQDARFFGGPGMGAWDGRHWAMVQWAANYLNRKVDAAQ